MYGRTSNNAPSNILVVDDIPDNLRLLAELLAAQGHEVRLATDGIFAVQSARNIPPDLILLDIVMPGMDGYAICQALKADERTRPIPVIFITALDDVAAKVKGFQAGGVDYITKPFQTEEVLARVATHLTLQRLCNHLEEVVNERTLKLQAALTEIQQLKDQFQAESLYLREEIEQEHNFTGIIGQSAALRALLLKVEQVAATDVTVLITGETGVGKELIARAIHHASPRGARPLVKVNCAALPAHLIESELFGHEKGAFTGALDRQIGRFEFARQGTIFLDEIGELPLELQPKLLRVVQDGEFERVGNSHTLRSAARVIAATNRDLTTEIRAGRFRPDLYYRLQVYPLAVPPLRERPDDIPLLVQAFVQKFNKQFGKQITVIPRPTISALQHYAWPGNIRELENLIARAMLTASGQTLRIELPSNPLCAGDPAASLDAVEREHIIQVLTAKQWRIEGPRGAAAALGLNPSTLRARMRKLGIQKPNL